MCIKLLYLLRRLLRVVFLAAVFLRVVLRRRLLGAAFLAAALFLLRGMRTPHYIN